MIKAGKLLVAHPNLPQRSLFANSVILITETGRSGTAGLIINKASENSLNQLIKDRALHLDIGSPVYLGGPVNPSALLLLHSDEWYSSNTLQVPGGFAITSDDVMFSKFQDGNTPLFWRFCLGMAGWHRGQLEQEIKQESWLTCDPEPSIIFEHSGKSQWRRAVDLCATQAVSHFF